MLVWFGFDFTCLFVMLLAMVCFDLTIVVI